MVVQQTTIRNWHKEIASFFYPNANEVFIIGIVERKIDEVSKNYLVGFWKIKKMKK